MGRRGADAVRRARLVVSANEPIGPYALVRLGRGPLEPGEPGQFFMLEAPGRVLPRPFSLCVAPDGELGYFSKQFDVYGREGKPCRAGCGGTVRRFVQGGRSTFHCPSCQR